MSSNFKSPPVFHPEDDDDYVSWKNDIGVWKLFRDLKPEKVGAAVYLSVKGQAREIL